MKVYKPEEHGFFKDYLPWILTTAVIAVIGLSIFLVVSVLDRSPDLMAYVGAYIATYIIGVIQFAALSSGNNLNDFKFNQRNYIISTAVIAIFLSPAVQVALNS